MSGGLFIPNGCRLDQWHCRWIFLGNRPWNGIPAFLSCVMSSPHGGWWPWTVKRELNLTQDLACFTWLSCKVLEVIPGFLPFHPFFVFLKPSLHLWCLFLSSVLLALFLDFSFTHPHFSCHLSPYHRQLFWITDVSLLTWASCCCSWPARSCQRSAQNHHSIRSEEPEPPIEKGPRDSLR